VLSASALRSVYELYFTVVVAMTVMRVVKVSCHEIIHVIAVRNRFVAAVFTVLMLGTVCAAVVAVGAVSRIRGTDLKPVLVEMAFVTKVQVAIMNVIRMPLVVDGCMTTVRAMLMRVILMNFVLICHG
jgi:hypothetical protein